MGVRDSPDVAWRQLVESSLVEKDSSSAVASFKMEMDISHWEIDLRSKSSICHQRLPNFSKPPLFLAASEM